MNTSIPAQIVDAIKQENCEMIRKLFNENPEQVAFVTPFAARTWLGFAAQVGKLSAVKVLVDIGFDVNTGDARYDAKPICAAAANDHYDVVKYLLSLGSVLDVSASIRNALCAAIIGRSPAIVQLLLEAGIDSKVRYNSRTMKNMDAVAFALKQGEKECARIIALWNGDGDEVAAARALADAREVVMVNARS
jgi:ankyrin repeat protein